MEPGKPNAWAEAANEEGSMVIDVENGMTGESPLGNVSMREMVTGINSPGIAIESGSKAAHHAAVAPLDTTGLTFEREAATVGEAYTSHGTI